MTIPVNVITMPHPLVRVSPVVLPTRVVDTVQDTTADVPTALTTAGEVVPLLQATTTATELHPLAVDHLPLVETATDPLPTAVVVLGGVVHMIVTVATALTLLLVVVHTAARQTQTADTVDLPLNLLSQVAAFPVDETTLRDRRTAQG